MKKTLSKKNLLVFLAPVMVVMLVFAALSVAIADDSQTYIGGWALNAVAAKGKEFPPGMFGMEASMTLDESGGGVMVTNGNAVAGTWEVCDGGIVTNFADKQVEYALKDGKLYMENDEMGLVFVRPMIKPPARTDVTLEDFEGAWIATFMKLLGMEATPAELDTEMKMIITGTQVKLISTSESQGELLEVYDGELDGYEYVFISESAGVQAENRLLILEDGTLALPNSAGMIWFETTK